MHENTEVELECKYFEFVYWIAALSIFVFGILSDGKLVERVS